MLRIVCALDGASKPTSGGRRMRRTLMAALACLCGIGFANGDEANAPEQPQVRMIGATTLSGA